MTACALVGATSKITVPSQVMGVCAGAGRLGHDNACSSEITCSNIHITVDLRDRTSLKQELS